MALINPTIPTIGQPNSTEDQDVANALTTIVAAINAGLDTANLAAAAGITAAQLATAVQAAAGLNGASTRRGKCIIATEESRTNTAYGTLTTPDTVASVVMPTDGLLLVSYDALWKCSVAGAGRAALFIGANQMSARRNANGDQGAQAARIVTENVYSALSSGAIGLLSGSTTAGMSAPPTTGRALGFAYSGSDGLTYEINGVPLDASSSNAAEWNLGFTGGVCLVEAAAGSYDISVQFKSSSGSVTAKERRLRVWSLGLD